MKMHILGSALPVVFYLIGPGNDIYMCVSTSTDTHVNIISWPNEIKTTGQEYMVALEATAIHSAVCMPK